jgi:pimeloyl-ACP methyl ester carboxylesterase
VGEIWARARTLDVLGVKTPVFEAGPADGTAIVLLHGNPDTHVVWSGIASRLASTHRCIAPDMPDFGESVAPADFDVSLTGQSRFVSALFDALDLPRAHLVCHDVGATYGLAFASEHADRLRSLTILNASFSPDYRWHFWARMWRLPVVGEIVMLAGNEWLFVKETKKGSPGVTDEMARLAYREFHPRARRMVLRFYRWLDPSKLKGWDEKLLASTAETPKQVLWGDLDPYMPDAKSAERFGVEAVHYPDAGHWAMIDHPDDVAARIASLVERTSG